MLILSTHSRRRPAARQSGLSIVELMIGVAVGLIVVAAASMTVATQLADNRKLLVEAQVQQDLRAAMDLISRDLRRAGYWSEAGEQVYNAMSPASAASANPNSVMTPGSGSTKSIEYRYDRREGSVASETEFGFCEGPGCPAPSLGMVRSKIKIGGSPAAWQPLTDDKVVNITSLTVTPVLGPVTKLVCPSLCVGADGVANTADDDTSCWPTHRVREAQITLTAEAVSDASVKRTLTSRVRLRNDLVGITAPGGFACP